MFNKSVRVLESDVRGTNKDERGPGAPERLKSTVINYSEMFRNISYRSHVSRQIFILLYDGLFRMKLTQSSV